MVIVTYINKYGRTCTKKSPVNLARTINAIVLNESNEDREYGGMIYWMMALNADQWIMLPDVEMYDPEIGDEE